MKFLRSNSTIPPLSADEQEPAFRAFLNGDSVAVSAGPGTGKSHTSRGAVKCFSKSVESIPFMVSLYHEELGAFAKSPHVNTLNFHKRGKKLCGACTVDNYKVVNIAKTVNGANAWTIAELVEKFKIEGVGVYERALSPDEIALKYEITDKPEIIAQAVEVLALSDADRTTVDYTDMLRHPVLAGKRALTTAAILLDEVQDFSPASWVFIRDCLTTPNNQVFMIGDPERQGLMAFAGANLSLFNEMAEHYGCKSFRLTVNRRCASEIVANAVAKAGDGWDMKALPDAPTGTVGTISQADLISRLEDGEFSTDAVISESNAPLLSIGVALMDKGMPVQMRTSKVESLIKRYASRFLDMRKFPLGSTSEQLATELVERAQSGKDCTEFSDVVKCVSLLENYCIAHGIVKTAWNMRRPIHPIFQALALLAGQDKGVTLLTGHTAKGLEWDTVFHLPGKMRQPKQDWQAIQQQHLAHVILTRARLAHYTVGE